MTDKECLDVLNSLHKEAAIDLAGKVGGESWSVFKSVAGDLLKKSIAPVLLTLPVTAGLVGAGIAGVSSPETVAKTAEKELVLNSLMTEELSLRRKLERAKADIVAKEGRPRHYDKFINK